ncbi:protein transport protein SEC13 homolog B-like [Prunus yedoensis var. nudiflora]|uniref:Protein transport protein SEC13 homolog B-like n=1 Tax=Prunus yedoensis var. nudiflora TaxID=2094558 RepID=A0A314ZUL7_PRUYE|nr:protein transport protein SEC13 homolog B-like [Prunus yedoensis var. nudiflora]
MWARMQREETRHDPTSKWGAHNRAMTSRNGALTWRTNAMMAFDSGGRRFARRRPGPVVHSCHMLRGFEVCLWANNFGQAQWAASLNGMGFEAEIREGREVSLFSSSSVRITAVRAIRFVPKLRCFRSQFLLPGIYIIVCEMPALKVETGHQDTIHDVVMDYYGKRLATGSADNTVKIIGVSNSASQHLATLTGHQGPVWQVAWAHPKFGSLLASCSYDGRVILWKEGNHNEWTQAHVFDDHKSSVNSIAWAPHELGLCLACGSSDGNISVFTARADGGWDTSRIDQAHPVGVTSVSWAPSTAPGAIVGSGLLDPVQKLCSGGC